MGNVSLVSGTGSASETQDQRLMERRCVRKDVRTAVRCEQRENRGRRILREGGLRLYRPREVSSVLCLQWRNFCCVRLRSSRGANGRGMRQTQTTVKEGPWIGMDCTILRRQIIDTVLSPTEHSRLWNRRSSEQRTLSCSVPRVTLWLPN